MEIICQIACKFTQQRLGLITFVKSKLEFTINFNAENVDRHLNSVTNLEYFFTWRFGTKWRKFRPLKETRVIWRLGGQLDFSHLLTEPKDSSTFDCTERNQGWMDCRTLGDIQNSMKFFYSTIGHENSFKIVGVLLSDI
jgi:hypothetical protein